MTTTPNRNRTVQRAKYLRDMAADVAGSSDPVAVRTGLAALALAGVGEALAEKYRLDKQQIDIDTTPPDGWCNWCSSSEAIRWIIVTLDNSEHRIGVCPDCYAHLNRGR